MELVENSSHPASKAKIEAIRAFLQAESSNNGTENGGESEEPPVPETVEAPGSINTRPWDREAYLERLHSFTLLGWFAKPPWLSPLHCARYGWKNTETDLLQCVSCRAYVSGHLPTTFDPQVYDEYCGKLRDSLQSAHHPCCPWLCNPSPESFMSIPVDCESHAGAEYRARVDQLISLGGALPKIVKETSDQVEDLAGEGLQRLTSAAGQDGAVDEDIAATAVALSICGWTCSSTKQGLVHCEFCSRTAGVWQHQPLHKHDIEPPETDLQEEDEISHSPVCQEVPESTGAERAESLRLNSSELTDDRGKEMGIPDSNCDSLQQEDAESAQPPLSTLPAVSDEEPQDIVSKNSPETRMTEHVEESGQVKHVGSITEELAPVDRDVMKKCTTALSAVETEKSEKGQSCLDLADVTHQDMSETSQDSVEVSAPDNNLQLALSGVLPLSDDDVLRSVAKHPAWDTESMEVQVSESGSIRCADIDDISITGSVRLTDADDASVGGSVRLADVEDASVIGDAAAMDGSVPLDDNMITGDAEMDVQVSDASSVKIADLDELSIAEENASMEVQMSERGSVRFADVDDVSVSEGEDGDIDVVQADDDSEMICAPTVDKHEHASAITTSGCENPAIQPVLHRSFSDAEISEVKWLHERSFSDVESASREGLSAWDAASVEVQLSETASNRLAELEDVSICESLQDDNVDAEKVSLCEDDSLHDNSFEADKDDTICAASESENNTTVEEAEGGMKREEVTVPEACQETLTGLSNDVQPVSGQEVQQSLSPPLTEHSPENALDSTQSTDTAATAADTSTGEDQHMVAQSVVAGKRSTIPTADERPAKKQKKKPQPLPFDPITEHRPWCPWATEQQLIRMSNGKVETVAKQPGWRQLLQVLLLETSPEKSNIVNIVRTTPPREALRNIRRLFDDWTSPHD